VVESGRPEWRWAATIAVLTVFLSSIPYAAGWLAAPPGKIFVGAVYDCEDYYSHLAKMQQGVRGEWRYRILFTPEDHDGAYINTFYVALGHLARETGLPPVTLYHLARPLCALALLLTIYWFVTLFVPDRETRRVAYLLACFSSGLGWLVLLITRSYTLGAITPVDFWFIEMYTFFAVVTFPHTCLAQAVHLSAFAGMIRLLRGDAGWRAWLAASAAALALAIIHPYSLLPLDLALALYWAVRWFRQGRAVVGRLPWLVGFCLVPLPLVLLSYRAISADPVLSAWQAQSHTLSPPPVHYLLGYGLVLLLAVVGAIRVLRRRNDPAVALVLWPIVVAPLLYLPLLFNLQRRMIDGVHVPLSILAAVGFAGVLMPAVHLSRLAGWLARRGYPRQRFRRAAGALVLAMTTPSTWVLLASLALAPVGGYGPLYYDEAEVAAVLWLGTHSNPEDTVLSSYEIGGYIPARIGHRAFWGHWAESIRLPEKRAEVEAFYSASKTFERQLFLDRYGVSYVFQGHRERHLGAFEPSTAPFLELAFREGDVAVYRVVKADGA
jgi:hypothetical protein